MSHSSTLLSVELLAGLAVLIGAFIPLASIPMSIVPLVAIFTVCTLPRESLRCSADPDRWRRIDSLTGDVPQDL